MTILETKINALIAEHLCIDIMKVVADAELEKLGADSLDRIEIVMELEEEYNISIKDDALDIVKTVNDLTKLVEKLVNDNDD